MTNHQPARESVTYWRCGGCKHILSRVVDGKAIITHHVILSNGAPVVVCPVCKTEVRWYSYKVEGGVG